MIIAGCLAWWGNTCQCRIWRPHFRTKHPRYHSSPSLPGWTLDFCTDSADFCYARNAFD